VSAVEVPAELIERVAKLLENAASLRHSDYCSGHIGEGRDCPLAVEENAAVTELRALLPKPKPAPTPRFGDRVRVRCGATGRALGMDDLALFVSAMDNSLNLDQINPDGEPPHPSLPVPTDSALEAACGALRYANVWGGAR
jgi:hypothetical protein